MVIGPFSEGAVGRGEGTQLFPQEGIAQKKKGEIYYAREKDLSQCFCLSTAWQCTPQHEYFRNFVFWLPDGYYQLIYGRCIKSSAPSGNRGRMSVWGSRGHPLSQNRQWFTMYVTLYHPHIFSGWDSPKGQTTISHRGDFAWLRVPPDWLYFYFAVRQLNESGAYIHRFWSWNSWMVSYCLLLPYHLLGLTRRSSDVKQAWEMSDWGSNVRTQFCLVWERWLLGSEHTYKDSHRCFLVLYSYRNLLHSPDQFLSSPASASPSYMNTYFTSSIAWTSSPIFLERRSSSFQRIFLILPAAQPDKKDFYLSPNYTSFVRSSTMDPPPKNPHW